MEREGGGGGNRLSASFASEGALRRAPASPRDIVAGPGRPRSVHSSHLPMHHFPHAMLNDPERLLDVVLGPPHRGHGARKMPREEVKVLFRHALLPRGSVDRREGARLNFVILAGSAQCDAYQGGELVRQLGQVHVGEEGLEDGVGHDPLVELVHHNADGARRLSGEKGKDFRKMGLKFRL